MDRKFFFVIYDMDYDELPICQTESAIDACRILGISRATLEYHKNDPNHRYKGIYEIRKFSRELFDIDIMFDKLERR